MTEVHTRKAIGFAVDVAFFSAYCFSGGILASYIKGRRRLEAILRHWLCTPLAIGLWAVTMFAVRPGYGAAESALLVPIFLMIVSGNDFHGLLSSRAFSFLGTISYSVYLLHPIVLYVCTRAAGRVIDFRTVTPLAYWTLAAAIGMVVILVSSLSYRFIEYPAMAKPRQARATVAP
jgi:peptidoglycan/LPS O-acetylase OafA/YrhL